MQIAEQEFLKELDKNSGAPPTSSAKIFRDPDHDYYIPQEDMSDEEYNSFIEEELYFDLNGEIYEPITVAEFWNGGRQISLKANGNGF